ncbi:HEAT repeat domain-containing protein [Pseudanabaena galeata UHCC 0370]|uniref:HEAT repeat domain-containing protein n=1 Tax=Pseudanabaena galeata UHCC 0370 TaxID=3110310 RepID=A0ABU5TPF8_9CYAN|nr:HEAT repeat domain-containing protein [Pseudanabaena galeata]MEA5479967.1 HEAT repeat domain-containing protein [Pseudanabaena galeata UHCC 0370]
MIDWLVVWGVTQAAGVVVYPILESLAQDAAKDYGKDFFKDCLKKVIHLPEKDVQKEAYGKALKVFLELIQDELLEAGYQETLLKKYYIPALKKFIDREEVASTLGMAFNVECKAIDTALLVRVWKELDSPHLPESMNWDFLSKSYIRAVKKIVQNSDKLRPIFEVQTLDKIADAVQEVAGIAPAFDLEKYAEGLREQYGNLKLESLDTTGVYYNDLKLWKIFIPQNLRECQEFIPQVHELPKDRSRLLQESGQLDVLELAEAELENHRKRYVEQPIRGVFEVLGNPNESAKDGVAKYAVILGDPGSGKSTLLQYLALIWAERSVRDLPLYPLPLLLELRTYARDKQAGKCKDIVSFIHGGNITCRLNQQDLHEKLKNGDVIALFDGIDEVFDPALRDEVVTDIHRFTNEYSKVRAIATSRWLGYKAQRLRDAGFQHFMLQELNDEQMQDFVVRWHDLNFAEGADKDRKRERLQKAIRESRSIKELAGNPLLLTMMAILNRNQELPRDRPELYNQASRVLLHQWDVERALVEDRRIDPKTIDYRDKQAMLRKVAYYMQSSAKGLAGNLISAAQLESILTDYLKTIEVEKPREIARIMIGQLRTRNFILCDLGGDSYGFVHRTFLEYFCAIEIVHRFEKQRTLSFEQIRDDVFGNHWQDKAWHEVLRLICGMIDTNVASKLIEFLIGIDIDRTRFVKEFRRQEMQFRREGLSNLFLAVNCLSEIRAHAALPISSYLLKVLQEEIEYPKLPLHWTTTRSIIKRIAGNFTNTLPWLKYCFSKVTYKNVREAIVYIIPEYFSNDPQTLTWLQECLLDKDESVRMSAIIRMSDFYKEDPATWIILLDMLINDPHSEVRWGAVLALRTNFLNRTETFDLLCKVINEDNFLRASEWDRNPRQNALETLHEYYFTHPKTIELLNDKAVKDPDEQLREWAKEQLEMHNLQLTTDN